MAPSQLYRKLLLYKYLLLYRKLLLYKELLLYTRLRLYTVPPNRCRHCLLKAVPC